MRHPFLAVRWGSGRFRPGAGAIRGDANDGPGSLLVAERLSDMARPVHMEIASAQSARGNSHDRTRVHYDARRTNDWDPDSPPM